MLDRRTLMLRAVLTWFAMASLIGNAPAAGKPTTAAPVDLFAAIEHGQLEVRVIPRNEFFARVRFTNRSGKPLTVKLPPSVAAVHVFKQAPAFNANPFVNGNRPGSGLNGLNALNNGAQTNRGAQSIGGQIGNSSGSPFGNGSNGNGQTGLNPFIGGPGFFSVPAEKTVTLPLHTVCLEHGKKTPSLRMSYELRPLNSVANSPALERLLATFHPTKTDRQAVQAAAWHLAGRMSWPQLRSKQVRHIGRSPVPYFTLRQLRTAYAAVKAAREQAEPAGRSARHRVVQSALLER